MLKGPKRSFVVVVLGGVDSWAKIFPNGTKNVRKQNLFKIYFKLNKKCLQGKFVSMRTIWSFYGLFSRSWNGSKVLFLVLHVIEELLGESSFKSSNNLETMHLFKYWSISDKILNLIEKDKWNFTPCGLVSSHASGTHSSCENKKGQENWEEVISASSFLFPHKSLNCFNRLWNIEEII